MSDWYDCLLCGIYQILRVNIYLWRVHTMFAFPFFMFCSCGKCRSLLMFQSVPSNR